MAFSPAFLDELRWRVPLAEVVGRKVRLTRAGREWKACCPFHNEKTPSFYVNEEKQFYHCFGCGAHGDVIKFVAETEHLSFPEAVERLAGEAGLEVPRETPEDVARTARLTSARDVMARAAAWFAEQLQGISGAEARAYLARRGLSAASIARFGLGWAPDTRTALKAAFNALGVDDALLIECGLLIAVDGKAPYDRFRGRVMFPVRDAKGRVVAFGGRLLAKDDTAPKYLNSPETALFDKGRMLFNLDQAGPVARKSTELIVVEGYMDVIALDQAGLPNAVAPLGTALTEDQIGLMWRVVPEPLLCFDGDAAGQRAALRAAQRALPGLKPGRSLRFMTLPDGQDPDDLVRSGGAAAFEALKAEARPLIDVVWAAEQAAGLLDTPERRADFKARLRRLVAGIGDPDVRSLYGSEVRARLDRLFERPRSGPSVGRMPWRGPPLAQPPSSALRSQAQSLVSTQGQPAMIRSLLLLAIRAPDLLADDIHHLERLHIESEPLCRVADAVIDYATRESATLSADRLRDFLSNQGLSSTVSAIESADALLRLHRSTATTPEQRRLWFLHGIQYLVDLERINREITEVEAQYREELTDDLFARQKWLIDERETLKKALQAFDSQKSD
jgi:DNA primase